MTRTLLLTALVGLIGCGDKDGDDTGDALVDDTPQEVDADGDGWPASADCDDNDADIRPDADEICNSVDDDCDGFVDADAVDATVWYKDADSDGFGDPDNTATACEAPALYTDVDGDCDDLNATVNPDVAEHCDEIDHDCDGEAFDHDAVDAEIWYLDDDGDGFGDELNATTSCEQPDGYASNPGDCDDGLAYIFPGAAEFCDGIDYDCDGAIYEVSAVDVSDWYADLDGDGYGDPDTELAACLQPTGYVLDDTDCDDGDALSFPNAGERCDGTDNDCDGLVDDEDNDVDADIWYADADGDGYGDPGAGSFSCDTPAGATMDSSDCDDSDADVNPAASESCDAADDDCDGDVDEDAPPNGTWYVDFDGDGYGDDASSVERCGASSGFVAEGGDCDDRDSLVGPDGAESCDAGDEDCDGLVDEGGVCPCDVDWDGDAAYMLCDISESWEAAAADCEAYGYHLVSVDDAGENIALNLMTSAWGDTDWWIGYTDADSEGVWVWDYDTGSSYESWVDGAPDDAGGGEDCAALLSSGDWEDEDCADPLYYICEAP